MQLRLHHIAQTIDICALRQLQICLVRIASTDTVACRVKTRANLMCDTQVRSVQATSVALGMRNETRYQTWPFPRAVSWLFAVRQCYTIVLEGFVVFDWLVAFVGRGIGTSCR